jgi:hypothetical protein
MVRIILGIIAGFLAWAILWFGSERVVSAIWPDFGSHQAAFQAAIENGGPFTANSPILLVHIALASIVSMISGSLAAMIAGENKRAPLILGVLLFVLVGLVKATMSWAYVPVWYHVIFTGILIPMTVIGGKLQPARRT